MVAFLEIILEYRKIKFKVTKFRHILSINKTKLDSLIGLYFAEIETGKHVVKRQTYIEIRKPQAKSFVVDDWYRPLNFPIELFTLESLNYRDT